MSELLYKHIENFLKATLQTAEKLDIYSLLMKSYKDIILL